MNCAHLKVAIAGVLVSIGGGVGAISGQDSVRVYSGEEIVVTASRIPASFNEVARNVVYIDSEFMRQLPARNIIDVLDFIVGIDLKQQGPEGVQAHAKIRGASFKQTLIMVDGVKMNDPQTSHHNLQLPINIDDVARIEVLKGQGSRLFGPNAFGGVINIITKMAERKGGSFGAVLGGHGSQELEGSLQFKSAQAGHRLSFSNRKSDGYRENTDFDILSSSYRGRYSTRGAVIGLQAGYVNKRFGADQFYGVTAPSQLQWENTRTGYAAASVDFAVGSFQISPKLSWRKNKDHYIYDRNNPSYFENHHTSQSIGAELHASTRSRLGKTALGLEAGRENLESANLGDHERDQFGLFFEHNVQLGERVNMVGGLSAFKISGWDLAWWPGLDIGFSLSEQQRIYSSFGRAFRVPTYTELYYKGRSNIGNPALQPEKGWASELGYKFAGKQATAQVAVFTRMNENLIDWGWVATNPAWASVAGDSVWQSNNIAALRTSGFEVDMRLIPAQLSLPAAIKQISINYTWLSSGFSEGNLDSKYVITHLKHQFKGMLVLGGGRFLNTWIFNYDDRLSFDASDHFKVDVRAAFTWQKSEFFLSVNNLFNKHFQEYLGIPQPGRWLKVGLKNDF